MLSLLLWLSCAAPAERTLGQWVWSDADATLLREVRVERPGTLGAVHIGTVVRRDGSLTNTLGRSPRTLPGGPTAFLVRLDDSLHPLWESKSDAEIAADLGATLDRALNLARGTGIAPQEVQLDYDCPTRLLPRYAAVLRRLRAPDGPTATLRGTPLWITSLVTHLDEPQYGAWFSGVIDGHLLQVFDTGDAPIAAARVSQVAARAGLPWRLGLGAFERGDLTRHRAWFAETDVACPGAPCQGVFVFPAGRAYANLLPPARPAP